MDYKIKSVVFGHAVGDALGVPVEFASRSELDKNPVEDMEGYGTHPFPAGCWSDDTSMSLAALDSLANNKLDWDEIMKAFADISYSGNLTYEAGLFVNKVPVVLREKAAEYMAEVGKHLIEKFLNYKNNK